MSKYTTELRYIVDNENLNPPTEGMLSLKNVLDNYPLYIESYVDVTSGETINRRNELNEKIINHYYFSEIGFETVPRFLFALKRKMNEIMKLYNQMYKSVDFEFNPLWNVDMSETFTHNISNTGKTTSTGENVNSGTNTTTINSDNTGTVSNVSSNDTIVSNENLDVESDTPQQGITEADIKSNTYASKSQFAKTNSTNNNDSTNTETLDTNVNTTNTEVLGAKVNSTGEINITDNKTETFTRREFGSSKGYTFAQNIEQWRNIMINVDMQVIDELKDLFMNVY